MKPISFPPRTAILIALSLLSTPSLVLSQNYCRALEATGVANFAGDCGPEGPSPPGTACSVHCVDGSFNSPWKTKTLSFSCVAGEWILPGNEVFNSTAPLVCEKSQDSVEYEERLKEIFDSDNSHLPPDSTDCVWGKVDNLSFDQGCSPKDGLCTVWCQNGNMTGVPVDTPALIVTCHKWALHGGFYGDYILDPLETELDCAPRTVVAPTPAPIPTCPFLPSDAEDPSFSYITCVLDGADINGHCFYSCDQNYTLPAAEKAVDGVAALVCEDGSADVPKCEPLQVTQCTSFEVPAKTVKLAGCSSMNVFETGEKCAVGCSRGRFSAIEADSLVFGCENGKWRIATPLGDEDSDESVEVDPVSLLSSPLMECTDESYCGEVPTGADFDLDECYRRTDETPESCTFVCKGGKTAHPFDTRKDDLSKGIVECVEGKWSVPSCQELKDGLRDNYDRIVSLL